MTQTRTQTALLAVLVSALLAGCGPPASAVIDSINQLTRAERQSKHEQLMREYEQAIRENEQAIRENDERIRHLTRLRDDLRAQVEDSEREAEAEMRRQRERHPEPVQRQDDGEQNR